MKMRNRLTLTAGAIALALAAPLQAQISSPPPAEERSPAPHAAPSGVIVERTTIERTEPSAVVVERSTAPSAVIVETSAPREQILVAPPRIADGSALHGGAVTPADNALLGQVLSALDSAPHMEGSTVTVVANNGAITMNGSAKDLVQAGRIERIAKGVAGANVTAMIDPQGA